MKKEDIEDILLSFSFKEESRKEAEKAFASFYREYAGYLFVVVRNIKKDFDQFYEDLIDAVVTNTFVKFYNNPPMNFEILQGDTDRDVNQKMKGYLSKMARNELYDLLNTNVLKQEHQLTIDDDDIDFDPPDIIEMKTLQLGENEQLLEKALMTLKERDRHILINIYRYHEEGKKSPKELRSWLAKIHNTTELNIRKIKSRSEEKIKEYFEKHAKIKTIKS